MTIVSGIEIEKNEQGKDAFIRIDLQKYGKQLQSFLQEVGIIEDVEFEKEWLESLSAEDAKQENIRRIRTWWKK